MKIQRALTSGSSRAGCSSGAASAVVAVPTAVVVVIMTMVVVIMTIGVVMVVPAPLQQLTPVVITCIGKQALTLQVSGISAHWQLQSLRKAFSMPDAVKRACNMRCGHTAYHQQCSWGAMLRCLLR